ncbi:MAG: hypothetical protein M0Z50_15645 [Planctomycetia bacterium]|nr:hypothetical protein [Planctomycetia bacterium]
MKLPSFQFYPGDWRKDPALAVCSLAARGLWIDIMCLAHESADYGFLRVNGHPMTTRQIARAVGAPEEEVDTLIAELEAAGVFSRTDDGAIYSRRMVRDDKLRRIRARAGRLGGNPDLVKQKVKQKVNLDPNPKVNLDHNLSSNQSPTPSSSSSSSTSTSAAAAVNLPRQEIPRANSPNDAAAAADLQRKDVEAAQAMADIGVDPASVPAENPDRIIQAVAAMKVRIRGGEIIRNPGGLLITMLKDGFSPPTVKSAPFETAGQYVARRAAQARIEQERRIAAAEAEAESGPLGSYLRSAVQQRRKNHADTS